MAWKWQPVTIDFFLNLLQEFFPFLIQLSIFYLNTGLGCKIQPTTEVSFLYNRGPSPTYIRNITDEMRSYLLYFELKELCTEGSTQTSGIFSTDTCLDKVFIAYKYPWKGTLGTDWNLSYLALLPLGAQINFSSLLKFLKTIV